MTLSASGVNVKAAVAKAATWGTAVACGADNGILIKPHTLKKTREALIDDSLGLYFPADSVNTQVKAAGDIPSYLRYDGLDLLIALAMGATGGAPVQQGATTAYSQKFSLADTLDGLFATFIVNNQINIDEWTTVKITGFQIKGQVGKPLEISFHATAIDRQADSVVNTLTTFNNVTFFETANRVLYSQGVFRLNQASDVALGSANIVYPDNFTLEFKRKMAGKYGTGTTMDLIDEPTNDGLPEVTLKLEFPRYQSNQYFADWDADTRLKMDMTFTGGNIAGTYNRSLAISLPNLKISNVELPMSAGILKHPLEFQCLSAQGGTPPAGMTVTQPFEVDVVNRMSTDVLA